jgi:hypothetical protein
MRPPTVAKPASGSCQLSHTFEYITQLPQARSGEWIFHPAPPKMKEKALVLDLGLFISYLAAGWKETLVDGSRERL